MIERTIAASAFLVNESRARAEKLSRDQYAKLWVDDEVRALWQLYNDEIYSHDPQALAVRNRFYLDWASRFFAENPKGILVNIAAGFTSYPYLLDTPVETIEIDLPSVIEYKRKKIEEFQEKKLIPERRVKYLSADLNSVHAREVLRAILGPQIRDRSSLIFMEGITYYLKRDSFYALVKMASDLQTPGSALAMDYWIPEVKTSAVFNRFCDFLERRCGHPNRDYNLLSSAEIRALEGYEVELDTDVSAYERRIAEELVLQKWEDRLPENFALLIRENAV